MENRMKARPGASQVALAIISVIWFTPASPVVSAVDHPFCLWTREEAAQLRKWIETDPTARQQYDRTSARVAKNMKLEGMMSPAFMDLFNYLVMDDKAAGERQKKELLKFIGERPEPMKIEFSLDETNHTWAVGGRSHNDRHMWQSHSDHVLRYDILYDELTPEQRRGVENTFRVYIDFQLAGGKPWHPGYRYDRTSWLPNIGWNRIISTHYMAVAMRDEKLIKAVFESAGGFKWFMDEYLGDGKFYMEEFGKYPTKVDDVLMYCDALDRLGLPQYGYGYTGANGGSARNYAEMYSLITMPAIEQPGTGGRHRFPWVTMGDTEWIQGGVLPATGGHLCDRELFHRRFPDGGFDYFLAHLRDPGQDVYMPTPFFGFGPMDPKKVRPPRPSPSYVTRGRGFALLHTEESQAYWESPRPAVSLQLGMYYPHYVHDCFSILQYIAYNRLIYSRVGKIIKRGYTGGDPFRDHVRGHCGVVVDGLQATPVDDGNSGTANHDIREDLTNSVRFVAARTKGVYPNVDQERALLLTDEYLFDLFWLKSTDAAVDTPRVYDWQVITFGDTQESKSAPWTALDGFADKTRATKLYLEDTRVMDAGDKPWTVTAVLEPSNAVSPGVRVSMLGEKDTLVLSSLTPGEPGSRADAPEMKGRSILATRTTPATAFVALHEPFTNGVGSHSVGTFECFAGTDSSIAVRIVGKAGSGIDDRILLRYGDGAGEVMDVSDGKESYSFADHAYVRIGPDAVTVVGKVRALAVPVKGAPKLVVNGKERPAQIADGILKAELDDKWPPLPKRTVTTQSADTNSLAWLIPRLHDADVAGRETAANAIGRMGAAGKEAIPALVECLKQKVRLGNKAAPAALAGIGPDAVPALIETMRFEDPYARYEAISAIRMMGDKGVAAAPALIRALDDENSSVRINACLALQVLGPKASEAIPALARRLDDPLANKYAAFALSEIGRAGTKALIEALADPKRLDAAAWGIERMGPDAADAAPSLIKALSEDAQFARAASALGGIGPKAKKAVPMLIKALDDATNRPAAVVALGRIGPAAEDAVPALIRVAQVLTVDKGGRTNCVWSAAAIRALGQIGPAAKDAIPLLLQAVQDQRFSGRATAVAALSEIGAPTDGVLNALAASMKDRDQGIRDAAGMALAGFGKDAWGIAFSLKECLSDATPAIRVDSASVLVSIGAFRKEALSALAEALESKDAGVCRLALNKTDKLGSKAMELLPSVKKLAASEDAGIRTKAAAVAAAMERTGQ
jgi:HEAT repeat protein